MKKRLALLLTLFFSAGALAQTAPVAPIQLTTNSRWLEPSTGLRYDYNGTTYGWWTDLGIKDSTKYVTPYFLSHNYSPIGSGVTSFNGRTGAVVPLIGDYSSFYPLLNGTGATGTWSINISGSSAKWTTGRTLSITGDLNYTSPPIDGSGNVTTAGTLATINPNVGAYGSNTSVANFTVDGKGRITGAGNTAIQIPESQVTNLATDLANKEDIANKTATQSSSATTYPNWLGVTNYATANFAPITGGGYVPNSRLIINGYAITGGHSLATDITLSVDSTLLATKIWAGRFVPFSGATHNVDLNGKNFSTTGSITGGLLTIGGDAILSGNLGIASLYTHYATSNVSIGSSLDNGYRLEVAGTTHLQQTVLVDGTLTAGSNLSVGGVLSNAVNSNGLNVQMGINGTMNIGSTNFFSAAGQPANIFMGNIDGNAALNAINFRWTTGQNAWAVNTQTGQFTVPNAPATSTSVVRLTDLSAYIPLTQKAAANGVATLDGAGKVPISQINDALLGAVNYQGGYNASTNTPALPTAASGNKGYYWVASTAGTQFGLTLAVGDWIISNGSVYQKIDNNNAVTNVFGRIGAIVANSADYAAYYLPIASPAFTTLMTGPAMTLTGLGTFGSLRVPGSNSRVFNISASAGSSNGVDIAAGQNGDLNIGALDAGTSSYNGAALQLFSNTNASLPGQAFLNAGNQATSALILRTGLGGTVKEQLRINDADNVVQIIRNGLGANNTYQLYLANGTVATSTVAQYSPSIRMRGFGWATATGGSPQAVDFYEFVAPTVTGTTLATGALTWRASVNGTTPTNVMTLDNSGNLSATIFTGLGTGLSGTAAGLSIGGNSATVTNGVYTTGSYGNPTWLASLDWAKIVSTPNTIAGYGLTTNFNTLGDARWLQTTSSANSDISVATGSGNPVLTFNRVLANGVTATTQSAGDNSTKVQTTAGTLLELTAFKAASNIWTSNNTFNSPVILNSSLTSNSLIILHNYTVATLPASPGLGSIAFVTDATSPSYLTTVVGGGSVLVPVFYDGTSWKCQ